MLGSLRQDNIIYILNKKDVPSLKTGRVVSVSNPVPRYQTNGFSPNMQAFETVVDIMVETDNGEKTEFKKVPSNLAIYGDSGIVISDSREAMFSEVEAMQSNSRKLIESIDYHKQVIDACDGMLSQLNPSIAKEREYDKRIANLEDMMAEANETMNSKLSELTSLVKKLANK